MPTDDEEMGALWTLFEEAANLDPEMLRVTGRQTNVDHLDRLAAMGGPQPDTPTDTPADTPNREDPWGD